MAASKPSPAVAETWRGIEVRRAVCVDGGFLARPAAVDTLDVQVDGRMVEVVSVGPQETWLCDAVAKQAVSKRPLGHASLFGEVRGLVRGEPVDEVDTPAVAVHDDKMADLGFDSDDAAELRQPEPKKVRVRKAKTPTTNITRTVTVPEVPAVAGCSGQPLLAGSAGNAGNTFVAHISGRHGKKLYIELDVLPWFVSRLRLEFAGLSAPSSASSESSSPSKPSIWWDFRDESWGARRGESRIRVAVRARMRPGLDFAKLSFDDARKRALDEIKEKLGEP